MKNTDVKQSKKTVKIINKQPKKRYDTHRYTTKDKLDVISNETFISTDILLRIAVDKLWVEWEKTNSITVGCGYTTTDEWKTENTQ
jgi:hypothetical protein